MKWDQADMNPLLERANDFRCDIDSNNGFKISNFDLGNLNR